MSLSIWQLVLVALLFILLFGRGRIPALMGDLAQGIKSFKQGIGENDETATQTPTESQPKDKLENQ
ncbi:MULTISPECIES: twin-arginine translocase TatA/TatE family subunit [Alteromonadaceae]|uniref:twin-arginine translocase TatA/TatE family subunit n=1 Tax=Alteromonadaceae TaxID=72275 RepID=UPI001C09D32E|nr:MULTISPECIES: twin-arginine translocase TatA/TatE family subunit [Aliiglaciecola]MBU2880282.1 twin-arginine translocase TatA/TatE family subunit [Aliiglaciecola lipolytica]MDO6712706.1 twin-arginine translocase TatA/TatE family subunit [Aliiglaciecola sp. 2_MG-2023]MDO6752909.1 twin-arginine translocase TatA/TatE family subunit [Aliiglaciecola sp. 1_MG-2023]